MIEQSDTYFLKVLQDIINSMNTLDELIETNGERQSKIDLELSDLLHLIEGTDNEELSDEAYINIGKRTKELRRKRRHLKNEFELIKKYSELKNRLINADNRQFLIAEIQKQMKNLNQPYNYRILNEVDIQELKESKNVKIKPIKKDNKKSKINYEILKEMVEKGLPQREIADFFGIKQPTISVAIKKLKKGVTE